MMPGGALLVVAAGVALAAPSDHAVQPAKHGVAACHLLVVPIAQDAPIAPEDLRAVACAAQPVAPIRFDRATRRVVAMRDLDAGAYLGRAAVPVVPIVAKGAALTLVSTEGAVQVRRAVTALQSATAGRVFVRDADGQVFAVRVALDRAPQ